MKMVVKVELVIDAKVPKDLGFNNMPPAVVKPLMMASIAQAFETMFQDMLIQAPDILKAEVVDVEEYESD